MSELDAELTTLEQALARLEPQGQVTRDAVLFQAGRASARRGWACPAGAFVSTTAAAVLGWLLWRQPEPIIETPEPRVVVVEKIVTVIQEKPVFNTQPAPETDVAEYLKLRREVDRWGVDALRSGPPQQSSGQSLTPAAAPRFSTGVFGWQGF